MTISDTVYDLCRGTETVSSEVAKDPTVAPGEIYKKLYSKYDRPVSKKYEREIKEITPEDLKRAEECGRWGPTKPSELFLKLFHDAVVTLEQSVAGAVISPPLIGSCGVMPLTIMSTVPDIMRHMANLIVRAEKEVIIATNYWVSSKGSTFVTDALRELSRRSGERNQKTVVKIVYDRGSPWQLVDNHLPVPEKDYTADAVKLPSPKDIPNIDLQVLNYHRPILGTFHAKFMIADRKYAVVQSNNIQDNSNFEMACHLEGPIVDSLYDMALITWSNKLEPPLPSHNSPAAVGGISAFEHPSHSSLFDPNGILKGIKSIIHPQLAPKKQAYGKEKEAGDQPIGPSTIHDVTHPVAGGGQGPPESRNKGASTVDDPRHAGNPFGNAESGADLRTETYLAEGKTMIPQSQIEHPSKDNALPENMPGDPHYDSDIAGEIARVQSAVSPKAGETRMQAVTRHLNYPTTEGFTGDASDPPQFEEYTPYIPHPTHDAFPIAMVNRYPYGELGSASLFTPQNEVWLSAFKYAKKNVFIQTPNLNAEPLIPAILDACRRGIDVYCYICLGYNDTGELLPGQGGTNEMVANKLYTSLEAQHRKNLHWFWYVAKDMKEPIVAEKKKRTCHIKLMIVDEHIGIQGSGNQDTQSWFHSQEVNVMFDSVDICKAWIDGLRRNQNTHLYGQVSQEDGIWRDKEGNQAKDVIGIDPGRFSWAKGMVGAVKRVQGKGGF